MNAKILFYTFFWVLGFTQSVKSQESYEKILKLNNPSNALIDSTYQEIQQDTVALRKLLSQSNYYHNPNIKCFALNKLGVFYRDKSKYKKALDFHYTALNIAKKNRNAEQIIISENMLGVIYRRTDEVIPAINHHQRALELGEKIKIPNETILRNIAISRNSLGNIYLTMNQLDDAYRQFSKSLEIELKIKNYLGLAINYQNIGGIFEKRNELDKALQNYLKSLHYNNIIDSELGRLICYNSIGEIYLQKNNTELAEKYILPTIKIAEKLQDDYYISASYINTGWLFSQQNNPKAEEFLLKGLKIAEHQRYLSSIIDANFLLSELAEKKGQSAKALSYYKDYSEHKEKLINETNLRYINDLNSRFILEKKKNEYIKLQNEHQKIKLQFTNNKFLFFIILISLLLLLASLYYWYRQKILKKDKAMLLLEQDLLSLQMNPHFIFNALNSIKSYIIKSDQQNAVYYLNNFAKLIRSILSGMNQKEFTLKEELSVLETYVSLEKMRLSGDIEFEIENKTNLDFEKIKIPSLLLQTFIENSIWHGLSTKEGKKKIKIEIQNSNKNKILIQVLDNGIGREQAKNLNIGTHGKNKSLGIIITEKRLQNYYDNNFSLNFEDLYENGKPIGTLVNLEIPTS